MKLVVDENHKNSKNEKWEEGDKLKKFKKIKVGSDSPKLDSNLKEIEFGEPWVSHEFKSGLSFELKADQEIYEWFCCGYLWYYDNITRNNAIDHKIHFKWESKKVSIYLFPSANTAVSEDNPSPAGGGVDPQPPPTPPPPPKSV